MAKGMVLALILLPAPQGYGPSWLAPCPDSLRLSAGVKPHYMGFNLSSQVQNTVQTLLAESFLRKGMPFRIPESRF